MTREPFKLKAWTATLNVDVHEPGDGTPCESSWCPDGTITGIVRRAPNPAWWDEQAEHARRRIQAAETELAAYFDPEPLAAANNNWRKRDAAVHRAMDNAKRAGAWQQELKAAKARLQWIADHRPTADTGNR